MADGYGPEQEEDPPLDHGEDIPADEIPAARIVNKFGFHHPAFDHALVILLGIGLIALGFFILHAWYGAVIGAIVGVLVFARFRAHHRRHRVVPNGPGSDR